ncbi:cytochrome P450 [Lipomyces kononenkoae]|uniref:Cytochrome P450 n=1 Tax=Lipomyces kononenkoae TaxID=34357 RepID=A0ACC3SR56_LIPKO
MDFNISGAVATVLLSWLLVNLCRLAYNIFLHPLKRFRGPLCAAATTWWKTYIEVYAQRSMTDVLEDLHARYGDVVRTGPNELHFSHPAAYNDIYNSAARWDKEESLYRCFGEDRSSFGFLTYIEAKQRKDVLQPLFSRRAIVKIQSLIREKASTSDSSIIDHLASVLTARDAAGKSSDLFFAFRCFTLDTITEFCFATSIDAMDVPDFKAPIVQAMEAANPTFVLFKHFAPFRKLIFSLPPSLAMKFSPETAGLTQLRVILGQQVKEVCANQESLTKSPHPIIYSRLLDPAAQNGYPVPVPGSLYEEAQAMMFAGTDTVGNTLMIGFLHILDQPALQVRLREEVCQVWPELSQPPDFQTLEKLPILTAAIKESLRMASGVTTPLPRIVPPSGATIGNHSVPGGTIVGMSSVFVHYSAEIFPEPNSFDIGRWLGKGVEGKSLDQWLISFSRGPRSCLGINLAWCELYLAFATMLRRFDMKLDGMTTKDLVWRDTFLPYFYGKHLTAWCEPIAK